MRERERKKEREKERERERERKTERKIKRERMRARKRGRNNREIHKWRDKYLLHRQQNSCPDVNLVMQILGRTAPDGAIILTPPI